MHKKIAKILDSIQNLIVVQSIRYGLIMLIPVLMIGSFALVFKSLPVNAYQNFLTRWNSGMLLTIFDGVYNVTFGMLAIYTAATVGYQYGILYAKQDKQYGHATLLVSLGSFFILSGVPECGFDAFAAKGMFTAIVSACFASYILIGVSKIIKNKMLLTDGGDARLGFSIRVILPEAFTIVIIAAINLVILKVFDVSSVYELLIQVFNSMFYNIQSDIARGLCFVIASSILWLFGMHGSNILEGVANELFVKSTEINIELVRQGKEATQILTKQFLDNFVLMGGCGATICLLGALLLFSKRNNTRQLARISSLPMIFNINEIMVFGLPIIYNATFIIPFICTPIVCFITTYICMKTGIVPLITHDVQWTTPVFISGYKATGSIAGSVLQLVNLCLGIAIYAPFVKSYDKEKQKAAKRDYNKLVKKLEESEQTRIPVSLTDISHSYGWMGKALVSDLQKAMESNELQLHYQPQFNSDGRCIGAEALMRWNHNILGNIYPPLIFQLAEEAGFLEILEEWVVNKAVSDSKNIQQKYFDKNLKISVNVTGITIQSKTFENFLKNLSETYSVKEMGMCIEITEQAAIQIDDDFGKRLSRIREMGYMLAVDDFSMGSTSVQYLTGNHFNMVKLDGSLVKGILDNPRCCEIISSIIHLSNTLELSVLAEYVSDEVIQKRLFELGCFLYQGWYYSPAITLEEFEKLLERMSA